MNLQAPSTLRFWNLVNGTLILKPPPFVNFCLTGDAYDYIAGVELNYKQTSQMCWRCATIHQTAPRIEQVAEIWCLSFTLLTRIIFCRPTFISVWWKALLKCSFTGITCTLCTCCCRAKSSAQTESAPLVVQSVLKCVDRFCLDHLLWFIPVTCWPLTEEVPAQF